MGLETTDLRLGFIPLTDCAPLVVAREMGFFEREGLSVELSREASWANVRDKVSVGALDGGHLLAPMTLAASMGIGGERTPMVVPFSLNMNGSAVTVSKALAAAMRAAGGGNGDRSATALKSVIDARRAAGQPLLTFAVVFAYSMHTYLLRYWLAAAGIDPDRDIRLIVAPPPRMAERLKAGEIDGFCVGSPWNAFAVAEGSGEVIVYATDFWRMGPDKVFGVTRAWADEHPVSLKAVVRALISAAAWADAAENRVELASLLSDEAYIDAPEDIIRQSLTGGPPFGEGPSTENQDYIVFSRYTANFPWRSHALWFLTQMLRWGQIGPEVNIQSVADSVYQPDIYRAAALDLGVSSPLVDDKNEGTHARAWTLEEATSPIPMAPDAFLDGRIYDPHRASEYVAGFNISRLRA